MNRNRKRQYTIRGVPDAVDRALRRRAKAEGISLNEVALDALKDGAGLPNPEELFTDLDELIGTWEEDPAFEEALSRQDVVDKSRWR